MDVKRIWFRVHGRVQGVNFRSFTRARATELGLTGWVQNSGSSHERVDGEAQGREDRLATFLKALDRGPVHAHVVKLESGDLGEGSGGGNGGDGDGQMDEGSVKVEGAVKEEGEGETGFMVIRRSGGGGVALRDVSAHVKK